MYIYLALGAVGFLLLKKNPSGTRAMTTFIGSNQQTGSNPKTAQSPRADLGINPLANQPWYAGLMPQGQNNSQTIINGVNAVGGLFTAVGNTFFNSGNDPASQTINQSLVSQDQTMMFDANSNSESYPVDPTLGIGADQSYAGDTFV